MISFDELEQLLVLRESDLLSDDDVDKGRKDLPDAREHPRRIVDDKGTERFRIVSLEDLDQEIRQRPIHVPQSKAGQIEDKTTLVQRRGKEQSTGLHIVDDECTKHFERLLVWAMHSEVGVEHRASFFVGTMEVGFARFHLEIETGEVFVIVFFTACCYAIDVEFDSPFEHAD